MTAQEVLDEIRPLGLESYRKVLRNHGVPEPMYGVKISEMKVIQKRVKRDYQLAKDLFDTGVYDAMYLAGLIADDSKMTKDDLRGWVAKSKCRALCTSTIPWVAAEGSHGWDLALEWIELDDLNAVITGWSTLCSLVAIKADSELDMAKLRELLHRAKSIIHTAHNDLRGTVNSFVICVGSYVGPLADEAMAVAKDIGVVEIDMGNTSCKTPFAPEYILKARERGSLTRKRKTVKC